MLRFVSLWDYYGSVIVQAMMEFFCKQKEVRLWTLVPVATYAD